MHVAPRSVDLPATPSNAPTTTPTRALLVSAALAAVQAGVFLALLPVLGTVAPLAPPIYAILASANTAFPLLARVLTRAPGTATITAGITALLVVSFSPIGLLSAAPLLTVGIVFDLVARRGSVTTRRLVLGAAAVAVALFAISLAVFSPDHLTPWMLGATLAGRLLGEGAVAVLVSATARLLQRAGVGR